MSFLMDHGRVGRPASSAARRRAERGHVGARAAELHVAALVEGRSISVSHGRPRHRAHAGGGGDGDPLQRDPRWSPRDVARGYFTAETWSVTTAWCCTARPRLPSTRRATEELRRRGRG